MALGGGIWQTQNKTLPGSYINFTSVQKASAVLSERGFAAMPLMLDWGPNNTVFTVTNADFQKNSLKIFGHGYGDKEMQPLRELFENTQTLYAYRLNGGGVKASNKYCEAKYSGTSGNKLAITITQNIDNGSLFDVVTLFDNMPVDSQTVANSGELKPNDFITWKSAELLTTAKTALTGGTDASSVTSSAYQTFLDKIESYSFNALGCPTDDLTTIKLFINFTKRMRDEVGAKFQTIIFNDFTSEKIADHEGVIEVANKVIDFDSSVPGMGQYGLIYWVTGICAGCAVNKSNSNKLYNGELIVNTDYTQAQLGKAIEQGRFIMHNVNGNVRTLDDINSLTTVTDTKGDVFKSNQTIRVCDQIANDVAVVFNTRYLGVVPNDDNGRMALWNDICKLLQSLEKIRAIENFDPDSVSVKQGDTKKAVVCTVKDLNIVNAMAQLYMNVIVM